MKKQKLVFSRVSKNDLKEMAQVVKEIEENGLPKHLVCKKLPHGLGRGVFLRCKEAPILKGQLIAPYAGEVSIFPQNGFDDTDYAFAPLADMYLTKQEQMSLDKNSCYHPRRLYSLKLNALRKGNFTRFINHSEEPNIVAHVFSVPSNRYDLAPAPVEIIFIAKKTIRPGEQLLICYEEEEKSYWGKKKPFPMTPKTFQLSLDARIISRF